MTWLVYTQHKRSIKKISKQQEKSNTFRKFTKPQMRELIRELPDWIRETFSYTNNSITTPIRTYRDSEAVRLYNAILIRLEAFQSKYWEEEGINKVAHLIRNYDLLDK